MYKNEVKDFESKYYEKSRPKKILTHILKMEKKNIEDLSVILESMIKLMNKQYELMVHQIDEQYQLFNYHKSMLYYKNDLQMMEMMLIKAKLDIDTNELDKNRESLSELNKILRERAIKDLEFSQNEIKLYHKELKQVQQDIDVFIEGLSKSKNK